MFLQNTFLNYFLQIMIYFIENSSDYFIFLLSFNILFAIAYIIKYIINLKR